MRIFLNLNLFTRLKQLLNTWLPQACVLCGNRCKSTNSIQGCCAQCYGELPWLAAESCPVCALPMLGSAVCGACRSNAPEFDSTIAAWRYQWPISRLIPMWKYSGQLMLGTVLASSLAQRVPLYRESKPILVPMPLHPTRQRERGFNQSLELARYLGRVHRLPVAVNLVKRIKLTPSQAELPWHERQAMIQNVFAVTGHVADRHIVLVDDVMTTAASLNELARVFKKAGAKRVDCWVLARTLKSADA